MPAELVGEDTASRERAAEKHQEDLLAGLQLLLPTVKKQKPSSL